MSPNARTLAYFRSLGFTAGTVEQRLPIPGKFVTRDFIGIIDIIAFRPGVGIIGIQTTSGTNHAARMDKAREAFVHGELGDWLASGGRFEVVSWSKTGARGKRKTWMVRREELSGKGGVRVCEP